MAETAAETLSTFEASKNSEAYLPVKNGEIMMPVQMKIGNKEEILEA